MPLWLRNGAITSRHARTGPARPSDTEASSHAPRRIQFFLVRVGAVLATLTACGWPAVALANPPRPTWQVGPPWAPLTPASGEMHQISDLFWLMLGLSGIVFAIVAGGVILSIVRYSAKPGQGEPTQIFGNHRVEMIWTILPTVILAIAFVATVNSIKNINSPQKGASLNINAIGHQWWWEFQYPTLKVVTANEVHVPAGYNVHFHVESADVIHSFWAPELARQIDANPMQDNPVFVKLDRPGIYGGACYEYCGTAHAWMKFRVVVQPLAEFNAWAKHQQAPAATPSSALIAAGEKVFQNNTCVSCHSVTGVPGAGGAIGPNLTHVASRWTIGAGAAPMSESDIMAWIKNPTTYKPGVNMPGYPFLSQHDLRALAAYIYSLK